MTVNVFNDNNDVHDFPDQAPLDNSSETIWQLSISSGCLLRWCGVVYENHQKSKHGDKITLTV